MSSIAVAGSTAQACGFIGTCAAPSLISRLGLQRAARVSQGLQLACLLPAALLFFQPSDAARGIILLLSLSLLLLALPIHANHATNIAAF